MRRTVWATWSRNSSLASAKRRWASSKKKTSLGWSRSPTSGRVSNSDASSHMRKVEKSFGRSWTAGSSRQLMTPRSPCRRSRSVTANSGSPKKASPPWPSSSLIDAQEDAGGGRGHAADGLQVRLALVAGEEVQDRAQVGQVEQGQPVLVGVAEDQGQGRALGLVGSEHLGQELGAEGRHGGPDGHAGAHAPQGEEGGRTAVRRPLDPELGGPPGQPVVGLRGVGDAAEVALHVGGEDRHADGRELFGHDLQGDRLARPGGARDQPVAVAHGRRDLDHGVGVGGAVEDAPAQSDHRPLRGVGLGDPGGEVGRGGRIGHGPAIVGAARARVPPAASSPAHAPCTCNRVTWSRG